MRDQPPSEWLPALATSDHRRGVFGTPLHYFPEIGSTNDEASRLAELDAPQGTTVVAAAQTAGRGRLGRTWFSPPGAGLYVSVIVREPRAAPFLTLAGGVAVAEGITAATGLPVEIKWPNDVVVPGTGRRWRKLGGILAEGSSVGDGLQYVILGFGINRGQAAYPPEIRDLATSLEGELGRSVDAGPVLAEILACLNHYISLLTRGDSETLMERWRALSPSAVGAPVGWDAPEGTRSGRTAGIAEDGALLVDCDGGRERIISGVVRWN